MAITHELIAKAGTYKNKDGEEKTRWVKCGVVMDTRTGGQALLIESLPINFDGWLQMREPSVKPVAEMKGSKKDSGSVADIEDDLPF
jgi:hypothetical protein